MLYLLSITSGPTFNLEEVTYVVVVKEVDLPCQPVKIVYQSYKQLYYNTCELLAPLIDDFLRVFPDFLAWKLGQLSVVRVVLPYLQTYS